MLNRNVRRGLRHLVWFALPALAFFLVAAECQPPPPQGRSLYIALGDSLSAGLGASNAASTAFVPLVHSELGPNTDLLNLGHTGDTSEMLLDHGHLDRAISEIETRKADDDASNDVELVTLEAGGNELLLLYFNLVIPGACPDLSAQFDGDCSQALKDALSEFDDNFVEMLDRLQAADPDLRIVALTLYNPFSHVENVGELGDLSLEGMTGTIFEDGLNDIVRARSAEHGVTVADIYPLFVGRTPELIAGDNIHPNDGGHRVMADAILGAWRTEQGE